MPRNFSRDWVYACMNESVKESSWQLEHFLSTSAEAIQRPSTPQARLPVAAFQAVNLYEGTSAVAILCEDFWP